MRTLTVRRERLTELTTDDLLLVAGADGLPAAGSLLGCPTEKACTTFPSCTCPLTSTC